MGLEGLVSKHRERRYEAGRCKHWIKRKNPKHPAYRRGRINFDWDGDGHPDILRPTYARRFGPSANTLVFAFPRP